MEAPRRDPSWIPLLLLAAGCLGLVGSVLGYFAFVRYRIGQNERAATAALKLLATAEADYRANDRDGNQVNDFWVGDVAGLYGHGLIPLGIAQADARPLKPLVATPIPYRGYYFRVLQKDGSNNNAPYPTDTDGSGLLVHNASSFGFCAYPARYGRTGFQTFIINEGNTLFKVEQAGKPLDDWPTDSVPPGGFYKGKFD